jgi:hypothetical protein
MVYHAASQGIEIDALESSFEGDIDIRGFTGLSDDVPRGYQRIRAAFRVRTRGGRGPARRPDPHVAGLQLGLRLGAHRRHH